VVNIHNSTWSPGTTSFPSLDYRNLQPPQARTDQGTATERVLPARRDATSSASDTALYTYISTAANIVNASNGTAYDTNAEPVGCLSVCVSWLDSAKKYTTTKAKRRLRTAAWHLLHPVGGKAHARHGRA
jgi:hypothetical protein